MRYLVLLAQDEQVWAGLSDEARAAYLDAHEAFEKAAAERVTIVAGEALHTVDDAVTMRHQGGTRVVTEGPFAETAEQIGAFYLLEAADIDVVLELCALLPHDYTLEIRPVADLGG
jgi:hypothetical protein